MHVICAERRGAVRCSAAHAYMLACAARVKRRGTERMRRSRAPIGRVALQALSPRRPSVVRRNGATVQRCNNATMQRCNGATMQRCNGGTHVDCGRSANRVDERGGAREHGLSHGVPAVSHHSVPLSALSVPLLAQFSRNPSDGPSPLVEGAMHRAPNAGVRVPVQMWQR